MSEGRVPILRPLVARTLRLLKQAEYWIVAQLAMAVLWLLRRLPPDRALAFADRTARRIGPWFGRHRVAMDNLRHAYPDKSEAELQAIASDMWGNMARLAGEYIFLDQLFDFVPGSDTPGRVEVDGEEIFARVRASGKPHIFFTAHTGNFELLPVAAASYDLPVTALFRAPNNPYIAKYIFSTRAEAMGELIASRAGAAFGLARILERGGNIGVLVDQKFHKGVPTRFFGRACTTSPLVAKLARQYECDVYPARAIRLPGNRFRLEISEKLELPRTEKGAIDVPATSQLLNDTVEGWVREHPGQWMWFHKRWKMG
ncbi:lipid A biosynthesis lauroyl acyltransferase [Mesorhizobium microcysteis]|uniref:Lipid A biosynthesis lauroyl acyltransferase n=1 Tax=Neoaquamicrobium microcysteis TaxID=2682781 RepID=A0A5D4GWD8_9HYPH|nr:lipid A biosynthesis lauroyl acyltransferase [Mesorhizobium microcysteis]TYR32454.1 lipid A biosynthesis lauroyl acyltransferase [Mesorhizobium microcysteis]